MTIQERVQEIFNRFNVDLTVNKNERTDMAEATLDNGTVIYTDANEFSEGAEAYIINDEGERIPLPPGDYVFEDGTVLSIVEGGVVGKIERGEGKADDKGKGDGRGRGLKPGNVTKPEDSAESSESSEGGSGASGGSKGVPADRPAAGKGGGTGKRKLAEDTAEDDIEIEVDMSDSYVTREMVADMIREAIEQMNAGEQKEEEEMKSEDEEMKYDEKKEEMSADEPNTPVVEENVEDQPVTASDEAERIDMSAILSELEETRNKLFELQKQAATSGLKHQAPTPKAKEPLNLKDLSTAERVRALANHYNA